MAEQSCEDKLAEAKEALHQLLTGRKIATVGYGDRRVSYTQANISDLRAYISELEAECGSSEEATTNRRRPFRVIW